MAFNYNNFVRLCLSLYKVRITTSWEKVVGLKSFSRVITLMISPVIPNNSLRIGCLPFEIS